MYFGNNVNCCFVLDLLHRMKSIDLMSLIHTRMLYNCLRTSIYVEHVIDLPLKSKSPLFTGCRLQTRCTNWLNMSGMANLQLKLSVHDPPPPLPFFLSLHVAATRGQAECLAVILAHGADVSLQDASGRLQRVFLHYFFVTSIAQNELNVNNKSCFIFFTSGFTALHLAAKNNHSECAKKLLQVMFLIDCES